MIFEKMNQMCKVCGEPAAGFHFGAFTCEGCKSFFGRTYNNLSSISECKNNGECVINKKNRTACKACRLRKCLYVGMSKSGSRYGRRSNWFKIHCLLQEQQQQQQQSPSLPHSFQTTNHSLSNPLNFLLPNQQQQQQQQQQQSYQNNNKSPSSLKSNHPPNPCLLTNPFLSVSRQLLNGNGLCMDKTSTINHRASSNSSSDSGASSADPEDSIASNKDTCSSPVVDQRFNNRIPAKCIDPVRSISEPLNPYMVLPLATSSPTLPISPPVSLTSPTSGAHQFQEEPIDLSVKSQKTCRTMSPKPNTIENVPKLTPLDLTLVRSNALSG